MESASTLLAMEPGGLPARVAALEAEMVLVKAQLESALTIAKAAYSNAAIDTRTTPFPPQPNKAWEKA